MRFQSAEKINGLFAAAFTAYNSDGSINYEYISELAEKLIAEGISGIFVCGTNGEGLSLTIEERKKIVEEYVRIVKGRIKVIVHVGHSSLEEAKKLSKHAAKIGADGFSSVCAFYFKPSNENVLIDSLVEIANSAPNLPFYYYHIPHITGVNINLDTFIPQIAKKAMNFSGIKFTSSAIHEYQDGIHLCNDNFDMLFGFDELLLPALAVGAKGAIGSTYNYASPIYLQVIKLFKEGRIKEAENLQYEAVKMIKLIIKYGPIPSQRAIMEMVGFKMGPSRLPLQTLSEKQKNELESELHGIGFFKVLELCTKSLRE
ncbi:dihydrodipicolinate synthase family protein [Sphingobacterium sp. 1.A.5]|uniref:dihydrodipicolinate synthase family protein n=1 Tax=Sphingobacterium sp. 1.A.5 TaxID=2044604 RepID=UPI000C0BDB09|nr:dihydrodipicolinate synthase family protein [Sphingobacterium sp. 1.A.5]